MAVTDWKKQDTKEIQNTQKLNSNIIISDKVSSLADPDFWGEYNIIEPEKSIESAIRKIQRKALNELSND
jgi:tRNA(Ile)-lysidine synthase TilS/MesJ